jgi:hypothetical protein
MRGHRSRRLKGIRLPSPDQTEASGDDPQQVEVAITIMLIAVCAVIASAMV